MSMKFITQKPANLIKNLCLAISLVLLSPYTWGDASNLKKLKTGTLTLASGKTVKLRYAISDEEQLKGLSGVMPDEFADDEGLLFYYKSDGPKRFWMPDTYFNLDIFFIDAKGKVKQVARDVLSHPGYNETLIPIARTDSVICRHVLEMKATSPLSKSIKMGDILKWTSLSSNR